MVRRREMGCMVFLAIVVIARGVAASIAGVSPASHHPKPAGSGAPPDLAANYPDRATPPSAAPRDNRFVIVISTASSAICTRLNAAVMPIFPPS